MYQKKNSIRWNVAGALVALGVLCAIFLLGQTTQAQTFTVLRLVARSYGVISQTVPSLPDPPWMVVP
jgi:hypothetical protein